MGQVLYKDHLHISVLLSEFVLCVASQKLNGKCFLNVKWFY